MGAYLSEPMTTKESEDGSGNNIRFGASAMQGWRVSQEDAHNCIPEFDKNSSYFAVYDGHGGAEVAVYLSRHLPDLLKKTEGYSKEDFNEALIQAFLKMDASIKEKEVLAEIQKIAKVHSGDESTVDYEEENVGQLYEEATMPLDKLVAQYTHNGNAVKEASDSESGGPSPCSSRKVDFQPASSSRSKIEECKPSLEDNKNLSTDASSSSSKSTTEPAQVKTEETEPTSSNSDAGKTDGLAEAAGVCSPSSSSSTSKKDIPDSTKVDGSSSSSDNLQNTTVTLNSSKSEPPKSSGDSQIQKDTTSTESVNGLSSKKEAHTTSDLTNGIGVEITIQKEEADSTDTKPVEISPKPRKGKVHPVPMTVKESPTNLRVSPRKGRNLANMAFADSESDLDSSDSDEVAKVQNRNSSSSEEDCEEEEEEDDDDEDDSDEDEDCEEDDSFLNDMQEPGYDSGCTAVVSFMKWEGDKLNLWVANAGDSRCVVSRGGEALDMSYDHKPESEEEALRIVNAGGKVTEDGRVNGGLNLSRAIGDHSYKQNATLPPEEQMISPLPSLQHVELDPTQDEFVVLACDGVWNSMTSQNVVDFVSKRIKTAPSLSKICEEMFDACLASDTYGDGTGCDNMTAIIVQLTKGSNGTKRSREEPEIDETSKKPKLDV